jgi:hypothetical protein
MHIIIGTHQTIFFANFTSVMLNVSMMVRSKQSYHNLMFPQADIYHIETKTSIFHYQNMCIDKHHNNSKSIYHYSEIISQLKWRNANMLREMLCLEIVTLVCFLLGDPTYYYFIIYIYIVREDLPKYLPSERRITHERYFVPGDTLPN